MLQQASDLISQATAKIEAQMRSGVMDPSVLNGLSQVQSSVIVGMSEYILLTGRPQQQIKASAVCWWLAAECDG